MSQRAPSIIESIVSKSEADARRIIQIAERVAERNEAAGREAAHQREENAMREIEEQASSQKALAVAQSQAEAERRKLAFRQELVEKLLADGLARLRALPRDEAYCDTIERLTAEAAAELGVKEAVVVCAPHDRECLASQGRFERIASGVRSRLGVSLTLSGETVNAAGGVIVRSADGKVSYYNTFDEIAYRRRSELKELIAQELFG